MPINLQKAEFILSAASPKDFIRDELPQVAFAGRSNVGKSSVINRLLNRKNLARVGAAPGKTTHINYFNIDRAFYLVDLPGYGYARTSKTVRDGFSTLITDYVLRCGKMHFLFVLADIRLEPQRIDLRFIDMLGEHGVPFGIVFTKADKLSKTQCEKSVERYRKRLSETWEELPPMFVSSSERGTGREEILDFIGECLKV